MGLPFSSHLLIDAFVCVCVYSLAVVEGSHLDIPRLHFFGRFRAAANTRNNERCNFDPNNELSIMMEWNYKAANEWEFINTTVRGVVDSTGVFSKNHPLVGAELFSNEDRPFAKMVDLDVDWEGTTLYGMEVGLKTTLLDGSSITLFKGTWTPSFIVQEMWHRVKCAGNMNAGGDFSNSASSTTVITNITWSDSWLTRDLRRATHCKSCTGDLSVSITIYYYGLDVFTIGYVTGTIGVYKQGESLNVAGERKLEAVPSVSINFPKSSPCYNSTLGRNSQWFSAAPFKVNYQRQVVAVDLSNSFPLLSAGLKHVDLGRVWLGIETLRGVEMLGDQIPYLDSDWMVSMGGVHETYVDIEQLIKLQYSKVVVVHEAEPHSVHSEFVLLPVNNYWYTFVRIFFMDFPQKVEILLEERDYYVRPLDYYVFRLEYQESASVRLYTTRFGKPAAGKTVRMHPGGKPTLPLNGVIANEPQQVTDENGLATFVLTVAKKIPYPRVYPGPSPCKPKSNITVAIPENTPVRMASKNIPDYPSSTIQQEIKETYTLPIDGQLYSFWYCVDDQGVEPDFSKYQIAILAFSTVKYDPPITWVDHVEPIFSQIHYLVYIMRTILDMSSYEKVTTAGNIELLKLSMNKSVLDVNYMPITRDLSPTKQNMILSWLDNPIYSVQSRSIPIGNTKQPVCLSPQAYRFAHTANDIPFNPPRCLQEFLLLYSNPNIDDDYFEDIFRSPVSIMGGKQHRPLYDFSFSNLFTSIQTLDFFQPPVCDLVRLQEQLQIAVQLEFYTIPLYLTSLYSIVDNCNTIAYGLMKNIVLQEMLHMTQVANILIATGARVLIDDPTVAPSYPATGLPGNVLPGLHIALKKFTPRHVYETFMAIETPHATVVARPEPDVALNTIGQFYNEISECIVYLGDDAFRANRIHHQVKWPWLTTPKVGHVFTVTDAMSALLAIEEVIMQGEGASPVIPNDFFTGLFAHFYRFEEIVCQNELKLLPDTKTYAYSGKEIPYDPNGVWPMRDNPSRKDIDPLSDCYREARAFHRSYRAMLRNLQAVFDGEPDSVTSAVEIMSSLELHAVVTMWTPFNNHTTCGPVWDYEWD